MCKYGRNKGWNPYIIKHKKKAARHKVKMLLKQGKWENLPEKIWIPYTD